MERIWCAKKGETEEGTETDPSLVKRKSRWGGGAPALSNSCKLTYVDSKTTTAAPCQQLANGMVMWLLFTNSGFIGVK
jgi:hypothetical protein